MGASGKPAIGLIDNDVDLRASLKFLFKSSGLQAVAYESAHDFLKSFHQKSLGCLVLEARLPGMGGIELLDTLRQRQVFIPAIFLTAYADVPLAVKAMRLGAFHVLEKPYHEEELLALVRQALIRFEKFQRFQAERQTIAGRLAALTPRELEVLDLMVGGMQNQKIAEELGISPKTLDIHRASVLSKMQTKTVADLVRWRLLYRADPLAINPLAY